MFKTKFGIYTANTTAIFFTSALILKKNSNFFSFSPIFMIFLPNCRQYYEVYEKGHSRALEKGNRASHPAFYV